MLACVRACVRALQHQDPGASARLSTALSSLLHAPGLQHPQHPQQQPLARNAKRAFKEALCQMVLEVRGIIRVR